MTRPANDVFQVQEEFSLQGAGSSYVHRSYTIPKNHIPERTDIKIMADTDTNSTGVASGFDIVLLDI